MKQFIKYADLHVHSIASDGTFNAEQLIKESLKKKLSAIAITDHDTVEMIPEAIGLAADKDLEIIPGIELTAQYENQEIHILGYFIDWQSDCLLAKLKQIQQNRVERVNKIISNLAELGVNLNQETVFDISGKGTLGRMHVARALVKDGHVKTVGEAFRRYIGDKSPAYVLGFKLSPKEAIKMINDAGGTAVLAHPYMLHNDMMIYEFIKDGLQGIEVYYPEHSQSMINFYLEMAENTGLIVTGGSDFHGSAKPEVKLGMAKIPFELLEKIRLLSK